MGNVFKLDVSLFNPLVVYGVLNRVSSVALHINGLKVWQAGRHLATRRPIGVNIFVSAVFLSRV